jgi:hypothetical protein
MPAGTADACASCDCEEPLLLSTAHHMHGLIPWEDALLNFAIVVQQLCIVNRVHNLKDACASCISSTQL